jgi:hypothetical protein
LDSFPEQIIQLWFFALLIDVGFPWKQPSFDIIYMITNEWILKDMDLESIM